MYKYYCKVHIMAQVTNISIHILVLISTYILCNVALGFVLRCSYLCVYMDVAMCCTDRCLCVLKVLNVLQCVCTFF